MKSRATTNDNGNLFPSWHRTNAFPENKKKCYCICHEKGEQSPCLLCRRVPRATSPGKELVEQINKNIKRARLKRY